VSYADPGEQDRKPRRKRPVIIGGLPYMAISMFDAPAPSVPRETSESAADGQGKSKRATDRTTILRTLAWQHDGLTRDQIADETGISPNTVRPRIVELITLGLVSDSRITRLTQTGRPAAVCEVTDKGRMALKAML
jgi:DNA-binding NarL/FixJ family response regulator